MVYFNLDKELCFSTITGRFSLS